MKKSNEYKGFIKRIEKFITPKDTWNPVEKALYTPNLFFSNYEENKRLLFHAIKHSFKHHYENNTIYNGFCKINEISPDNIKSRNDLFKIPLLPDSFFKDYPEGKDFLKWLDNIYTGTIFFVYLLLLCISHW